MSDVRARRDRVNLVMVIPRVRVGDAGDLGRGYVSADRAGSWVEGGRPGVEPSESRRYESTTDVNSDSRGDLVTACVTR